jgi:hypothetical protein
MHEEEAKKEGLKLNGAHQLELCAGLVSKNIYKKK